MQCTVHLNRDDATGHIPFLMDVQAGLPSDLETRVVVPLVREAAFGRRASRLHPLFTADGQRLIMATHLLAAVRRGTLGSPLVSLLDQRDVIVAAIDVLWAGV